MAKRRAPRNLPTCTAILLCERTIYNAETEKNSVIEILDTIPLPEFPSTVGPVWSYARLVRGVGGYAFRFEIHDLNAGEIAIATQENMIEFGSTEEVVTLTARLPAFEVTGLGPHDLVVFADDREVGRFTFHVVPYQDEGGDDGTQNAEGP